MLFSILYEGIVKMPNKNEIFEKVKKIISEESDIDEDDIKIKSSLVSDLEIDSIDRIGILQAIEIEFDLERIEDDVFHKLLTVENIVKYIDEQINRH